MTVLSKINLYPLTSNARMQLTFKNKIPLNFKTNEMWLAYMVSKAAKHFFEKHFKKTFNKLLERIELGINNHGNYPQHLIKLN